MKIAFIHNEKKIGTGAHYINDLISTKLRQHGVSVKHFYPTSNLINTPIEMKGLSNILFFHSLLEHRDEILKCDLIQGTTYTPLTYLSYDIPVISHFGSTTAGFLKKVPLAYKIDLESRQFWYNLQKSGILKELNIKTHRPLRDIAEIEKFVAIRSNQVIATSKGVAGELREFGVKNENLSVIHNAIEDYWFELSYSNPVDSPSLVFLGRMGDDSFNLKLKGIDRLYQWYKYFPSVPKKTIGITTNEELSNYLNTTLPGHRMIANVQKDSIPKLLNELSGSILFIPSRYEGFSLSLIEGMSQGLVPVVFPVGVAPEIIQNGVNGFIVNNLKEAYTYTELLLQNSALRKQISLNAYLTAQRFNADGMVKQFISIYQSMVEKKTGKFWTVSKFFKKNTNTKEA